VKMEEMLYDFKAQQEFKGRLMNGEVI
jgi:hypothetical protein